MAAEIRLVNLADDLLSTVTTIHAREDDIRLTAQQAALSDGRSSGIIASTQTI